MAPEVTLHEVKLRNFHNSTLSAVGSAKEMTYERSTADVHSTGVTLDVFQQDAPAQKGGARPPATHLTAAETVGNLLTKGIDATGGVTAKLPTGLSGKTSHAFFDSPEMRATGSTPVTVDGPDGFWLRADGFDLHLRSDVYEFVHPETRTRGP
jgi:lipopolysaccharide export system protein LptC